MPTIFKTLASSITDVMEKQGIVEMYWSAFGNRDSDGDIILPGAYAKTIAERGPSGTDRIKFLLMHDPWMGPIGKPLALKEDDHGLWARVKMLATQAGREALLGYVDDVWEHSVGIDVVTRGEDDLSYIVEARLWEGSAVTWGANPLTPTLSVKGSQVGTTLADRVKGNLGGIRRLLKKGITDETAANLELALAILDAQVSQLCKSGTGTQDEPAADTVDEAAILDQLVKGATFAAREYGGPPNRTGTPTDPPLVGSVEDALRLIVNQL